MSRGKVIILGCGPSGLLAAHAAVREGFQPLVFSVKRKSQLFGCQYLHQFIPGLGLDEGVEVDYQLVGTAEEYQAKVYGPEQVEFVSPAKLSERHWAWDIRHAYDELWKMYEPIVTHVPIEANDIDDMLEYYEPAHMFSTIPLPRLCSNPDHAFNFIKCWAIGDAPELDQEAPRLAPPFTVVCDGTENRGWYRASNVFGYNTVEWPGWRRKPPISGIVEFLKPLSNKCDCHPRVVRLGRMGEWRKGVLAHEAFNVATEVMKGENDAGSS